MDVLIVAGLVIVLSVIAIVIWFVRAIDASRTKCPSCEKKDFLVEKGRKLLNVEDFSKIERRNRYDKQGRVVGSREVRVFGKKETYLVTYYCTNCKHTFTTTVVNEKITH